MERDKKPLPYNVMHLFAEQDGDELQDSDFLYSRIEERLVSLVGMTLPEIAAAFASTTDVFDLLFMAN